MGMFDYLNCKYPLPYGAIANSYEYQTKDTPAQFMDRYEIREDGTFWHQAYDVEDRSDKTKEGLEGLIGCMTSVNHRWEECRLTGEVRFYDYRQGEKPDWIEFSAYFVEGKLKELHQIEPAPESINDGKSVSP